MMFHQRLFVAISLTLAAPVTVWAQPAAPSPSPSPSATPAPPIVDVLTPPRRVWQPLWGATLPFAPDAALVNRATMYLIRRDANDQLVIVSSPLTGEGSPNAATPDQWGEAAPALLADGSPLPAGTPYALVDRWALLDRQAGRLAITDPTLQTIESHVGSLPLAQIDSVTAAWGRVLLTGRDDQGRVRVAAAFLPMAVEDDATSWTLTLPLPEPRRGVATFASERRAYVMGGTIEDASGRFDPPMMLTHAMEGEAAANGWIGLPFPLRPAPGRSVGVQVDRFMGVMGENRVVDGEDHPSSPTLAYTLDQSHRAGAIDPWRPVLLDLPELGDVRLVASADQNQIIVMGIATDAKGTSSPRAWGFQSSAVGHLSNPRDQYMAMLNERAESRRLRFGSYAETLELARRNKAHHVVVFLGDDADSDAIRQKLTRDPNVVNMMRGMLLSSPWPEDIEEARASTGVVSTPAFVLLDPEGNVVNRKEGTIKSAADMVKLLGPALGPAAVTPTPEATP